MTTAELAGYLRLSPTSVYRLVSQRKIPIYKVGRGDRFDKKDVDAYLEKNCIKPIL